MISKLLKSVREFKLYSFLSPLFVMLESFTEVAIPFLMGFLIDSMSAGKLNDILMYSAILIILAFVSLYFGYMSAKYSAIASSGFGRNLRKDIYYKIQEYSFSNIDKFSSSSLVTRMTTDVMNVQNSFGMIIRIAVRAPIMMIFSVVMAFSINVTLSWIFVVIIPVLLSIIILIIRLAMKAFTKVFKKYDKLNSSIQENINGIRVVKNYVKEDYEKNKFKEASEEVRDDFIKAEKIVAWNNPAFQFFMFLAMTLVAVLSSFIIIKTFKGFNDNNEPLWGELSTGNMASLITYGMQILSSLMMLSMIIVMISISIASAQRIVEVLDEKSSIVNPLNPVYEVNNGDIEFNNVSFKYKTDAAKFALKNINLSIKSGETIGIIGGTGSAKSTLVSLISRLYDTTQGEVLVGDINVKDYDLETLRNAVAVVLQKNILFSGTIRSNLCWGNEEATDKEIEEACTIACAKEFIDGFKDRYDTVIEQGGTNVSGGQKQRLCIARALLKKPKVLILDDSTSAVDTKTDSIIREGFKNKIPNTTKIIIAQRISSVKDADKILVLENGEINGLGTHEQLLKSNEIYKDIFNIQNKIGGNK